MLTLLSLIFLSIHVSEYGWLRLHVSMTCVFMYIQIGLVEIAGFPDVFDFVSINRGG